MKYLTVLFLLVFSLHAAAVVPVGEKYKESSECQACHNHLVKQWRESWHSNSHYNKDEYFRKSVDFVSRKTHKSLNAVKVECATCHNPRISVTSTDVNYEIAAVLGLDKNSKVNKAVHDSSLDEGINCVVCHNIDEIHSELDATHRGMNRVSWSKTGYMVGPFKDANSPYHKTEYREFMDTNPNQLCFVCHANDHTANGDTFINMQAEYKGSEEKCVDCHMSKRKELYAATLPIDHGKPKKRMIREHWFDGGHIKQLWKNAIGVSLSKEGGDLAITLKNDLPHNIPSGFGAREILVDVTYKNLTGVVATKTITLTRYYIGKYKRATIPHMAVKVSKDESIPAKGEKVVKVKLNSKATVVEVSVSYKLVNDQVRELLKLEQPIWSEKMPIAKVSMRL